MKYLFFTMQFLSIFLIVFKLKFNVSNAKISEKLIGDVFFNSETNIENKSKLYKKISESEIETFDLQNTPNDICDLLNNSFLSASWPDKNLILFDSNFKPIKTISSIHFYKHSSFF